MTTAWAPQPIAYGSFQLNQRPFVVDSTRVYSAAPQRIERMPRIYRAGSIPVLRRDEETVIELAGRILTVGPTGERRTKAQMEADVDLLKLTFKASVEALSIGYDDGRYYEITGVDGLVEVTRSLTQPWETFWSVRLLASNPYAHSLTAETVADTEPLAMASANLYGKFITVDPIGTAPCLPLYTIEVPLGAPAISQIYVQNFSADPVTIRLTVTQAFSPGDVLTIDCDAEEVKVNDVSVPFSGAFPELSKRFAAENVILVRVVAVSLPASLPCTIQWTPLYE